MSIFKFCLVCRLIVFCLLLHLHACIYRLILFLGCMFLYLHDVCVGSSVGQPLTASCSICWCRGFFPVRWHVRITPCFFLIPFGPFHCTCANQNYCFFHWNIFFLEASKAHSYHFAMSVCRSAATVLRFSESFTIIVATNDNAVNCSNCLTAVVQLLHVESLPNFTAFTC